MRVGVIGLGSWGTALALQLMRAGQAVAAWGNEPEHVAEVAAARENRRFLPGARLDGPFCCDADLGAVVAEAEALILAVPSRAMGEVCRQIARLDPAPRLVINASKGLVPGSGSRLSSEIGRILPGWPLAVLSGPSHAEEVAVRSPTAVVTAAADLTWAEAARGLIMTEEFRVYTSTDLVGVEIGGALKNVIALAAGSVDGLGFGDNTKAALITRGLAEMARLGRALGAQQSTLFGLAGLGDLVATCASRHSRNRYVGEQLGRGRGLEEILAGMTMVAEGVATAATARDLARLHGVEIPITEAVCAVLAGQLGPEAAVRMLMTREPKLEAAAWQEATPP